MTNAMNHALLALAASLLGLSPLAHGQMHAAPSAAICQLPDVLQAWNKPPASIATVAARVAADPGGAVLQPYRVRLAPCQAAWCKPGSHAAMVKIDIALAGRYRVAVDQMLWIDLFNATDKLEGVLCEHSGCQPIRKIVQFDVNAGPHWVVLESKGAIESGVLVMRVGE